MFLAPSVIPALSENPADSVKRCKLAQTRPAKLYQNGTMDAVKSRDTSKLCHLCKNYLHFDRGNWINMGAIGFGTTKEASRSPACAGSRLLLELQYAYSP